MNKNWQKIGSIFIFSVSIALTLNIFVSLSPALETKENSIEKISNDWRFVFFKKDLNNLLQDPEVEIANKPCSFYKIRAMGYPFSYGIYFLPNSGCLARNDNVKDISNIYSQIAIFSNAIFWGIFIFPLVYIFENKKHKISQQLEKLQVKPDSEKGRRRLEQYKGILRLIKIAIVIVSIILALIVIGQFNQ